MSEWKSGEDEDSKQRQSNLTTSSGEHLRVESVFSAGDRRYGRKVFVCVNGTGTYLTDEEAKGMVKQILSTVLFHNRTFGEVDA